MALSLPPERQFDFWLGDWTVAWGDGNRGSNRVRRILDGKVIEENFDANPAMPFRGRSVSVYSEKLGIWRQTWVDTDGNYWAFEGGLEDGEMILATDDVIDGTPVKLRMVFYNIEEDSLEWRWESSVDGGETWKVNWHLQYARQK